MSSYKRRKLVDATGSHNESAFAVRERLRRTTEANDRYLFQESKSVSSTLEPDERQSDLHIVKCATEALDTSLILPPAPEDEDPGHVLREIAFSASTSNLKQISGGNVVKVESNVEATPQASKIISLSSFIVTADNHKIQDDGDILIQLVAGERLVLLGIYGLSVLAGHVSILGATLTASDGLLPVYALSSHALPVIRSVTPDSGKATIRLHQHDTGFHSLGKLSPLFKGLSIPSQERSGKAYWNDNSSEQTPTSTFSILTTSSDNLGLPPLRPLKIPAEWNALIGSMIPQRVAQAQQPFLMVCGPKSSGKSTFAKLLCNRIMSIPGNHLIPELQSKSVLYLDLDPGQPEFSAPGQMSLVRLRRPILGPAYTHPKGCPGELDIIRAHSIYSNSPASDPELYLSCALNLLSYCKDNVVLDDAQAVVINTPGWILGTGLELLIDIIRHAHVTRVLYMSRDGPSDVVMSLEEATKPAMFSTLQSQAGEESNRTAAQLRIMQAMSYFHLLGKENAKRRWSELPLPSIAPWVVKYEGPNSGILGILCQGEQPPLELLSHRINASLLTVVLVDDISNISKPMVRLGSHGKGEHFNLSLDSDIGDETTRVQQTISKLITATPEGLPYLQLDRLDPEHSQCVGLILLRGIDARHRCLHVLSSIPPETLEDARNSNKHIVLVSGKLDTPAWAYTESLHAASRSTHHRHCDSEVSSDDADDKLEDVEYDPDRLDYSPDTEDGSTPYVEQLDGHTGRGKASRVWKVRRDLGRFLQSD